MPVFFSSPQKFANSSSFCTETFSINCTCKYSNLQINGILKCDSRNVFYLISCKCCGKQNVGSATGFKEQFWIHKSDINTGKVQHGVVNHLLNVCRSSASKFEYLQEQLIEKFLYKMMTILTKFCGKEKNTGKHNYLR